MTEDRRLRLQKRIDNITKSLEQYYEAELTIINGGQQYSLGSRSLTRANLGEVREAIIDLENLLEKLKSELNGRGRNLQISVVPLDI